ncbi:hypothetical protein CRUP_038867, partial [Coryphaenoides rupestris]
PDGQPTLLAPERAQAANLRATGILSGVQRLFAHHMVQTFGCDYSTAGVTLEAATAKLRAFLELRTADGPRHDTYLLFYSGHTHPRTGTWALAGTFSWRRNGKYLNVARDPQASMRRRSGTLDIYAWKDPQEYEAEYQCIASNEHGSAYSHKIMLRLSRPPLWPNEILEPVVVSVGLPLVLTCDPPPGPPKPETYWMSSCSFARPFSWPIQTAFPTMQPVRQDRRVSTGVNGDLYFANVLFNDSQTDYCCNARLPHKNSIQQKRPVVVKVITTRTVSEAAPTWLSPTKSSTSILGLQGEELLLECIAAGVSLLQSEYLWRCVFVDRPTPHVTWTKDGERLTVKPGMRIKNFNKMIHIAKASFDDIGEYVCAAANKIGYTERTITVRVKAAPFWLEKPVDLVLAPEEDGRLVCRSDGIPRPTIHWFLNGESLETAIPHPSRHVSGDTLSFRSVTMENTGVYQCNASNEFGYLMANAFVNTSPEVSFRSEHLWRCVFSDRPTPHVTWTKDGERLTVKPGMRIKNFNKMIHIAKASFDDIGEYVCAAANKIGYTERTITVRVKAAPFWLEKPVDLVLAPEEDGRLVCRSDGIPRPTIHWFLNGESLENATPRILRPQEDHLKVVEGSRTLLESKFGQGNLEGGRYRTHSNGTLEIKQTRVEDTGTYLCIVTNIAGRDESQIKIEPTLFVSKPQNLKVIRGSDVTFECAVKSDLSTPVTTTWLKNKKPLTLNWRISLVESNLVITSVNSADDGDYTCSIKTEMDEKSASARLMVMDRPNPPTDLQLSDPYERTVRLSWVPGDNNHSPVTEYLVQYDEDDWLPGKWRNLSTYPGTLNSVILQLNPYTYYEFRVVAVNGIGPSRPSRVSARLQTGGAPPDVIPRNIRGVGTWRNNMEISWEPLTYREWNGPHLKYLVWWKRKDSREEWKNATTKWLRYYIYDADTFTPYEIKVQAANDFGLGPESPVIIGYSGEDRPLTAPLNLRVSDIESTQVTVHWDPVARTNIMGEFKEYKVYFWRDSSQLKWLSVSRAMKSKAIPTVDPDYSGVLDGLFPYSNYKMHIVVANNRFDGPPSNTIQFSTPEGVPSVPKSFRIQQRHLDTIYVDWDLPAEPNGIITGYTLQYQTGKQLPSLCLQA